MIDWVRVRELHDEIGADDFAEVVGMFLDEADEVITRLSNGPPGPAVGDDLHFLKGSALNLGFDDLAQLCQEGERAAAAGLTAGVELRRLTECYARSKEGFLGGLEQALAA